MAELHFVFCVHNHQPVGNFGFVLEDAYRRAYRPFLDILEEYPDVPFALHTSGCLLEWIEREHPEYVERLGAMARRGQVEILTGGFYEPILAMIPDEDKILQITRYTRHLKDRLGVAPRGLWLTERVWEPQLPRWLHDAGVEYTGVDDFHFRATGFAQDDLTSHFTAEEQGRTVCVFPMSETLRYHLPFRSPEETETYLRSLAEKRPGGLIVFGDDGEKFGVWPGTYATCYEKGWLRSFLEMLRRNREWLRAVTFSQWLDGHESAGLAYLPTLTYPEMMEWALPAERWGEYRRSREVLREQMSYPGSPTFLRGGYWRSFLAKYPESYRMYRKMLDVRGRLEDADPEGTAPGLAAAWQDYWRAQCNCAYWHGVFGGLYLKHLRTEIYRRLISAESAAEEVLKKGGSPVRSRVVDVDGDRHPEVALLTPDLTLWVAPRRGGTLFELDFKPSSYNLFAALARRREGYHDDLRRLVQAREAAEEGGTRSIHDRVEAKEEGLENYLVYDRALADSGADHFLDPAVTLRDLREDRFEEKGDFAGAAFEILRGPTAGSLVLGRPGEVRTPSGPRAVRVTKTVSVEGRSGFRLAWEIEAGPEGVEGVLFGTRFYVALSDPAIPECYVLVDGKRPDPDRLGSEGDTRGGGSLTLVDRVIPVQVDLECPGARLVRYPVYTVSLSEGGFEKSYQSSVVAPLWEVRLAPGGKLRAEVRVSVSVPVAVEEASAGKVGSE